MRNGEDLVIFNSGKYLVGLSVFESYKCDPAFIIIFEPDDFGIKYSWPFVAIEIIIVNFTGNKNTIPGAIPVDRTAFTTTLPGSHI